MGLCMRIFKNRIFKAVTLIILVVVFLVVTEVVLGRALNGVNSNTYFSMEMAAYEKEGREADILFLGSSRVYHGFVPEVFEQKLGMDLVINAGSATQRPESSYYMLKDMYRRFHPKIVVFGVQWNGILDESTDAQRLESAVTIAERMSVPGKLTYIPNYIFSDQLPNFSLVYRNRNNFRFDKMSENITKYIKLVNEGYTPDTGANSYYHGKGFVYANTSCEPGNIPVMDEEQSSFTTAEISQEKVRCLDRICDFCEKKGIRLFLVATPVSMMNMYHIEGYQEAVDFYTEYAKEKGISFCNLNYLKDREEWFGDERMTDYVHMSGEAAEEISAIYADILDSELNGKESSAEFYPDLDALKKDVHRVVALRAGLLKEGENVHISIEALSNDIGNNLYRIEFLTADGNAEVLREWEKGSEIDVTIPAGKEGRLKISACTGPDDQALAWQEYEIGGEQE